MLASVPSTICTANDPFWVRPRAAGFKVPPTRDCWLLSVDRAPADRLYFAIDLPRLPTPPSSITSPLFLVLILAASGLLSLIVARLATAPLRQLAKASQAFARSVDAEPVPETGPADVRRALATFNLMQERVREGLRERTRILAAISHDLQTPLTRLRLRLEQVEDEPLRERLVADLSTTLAMVKRGLDLARSSESAEALSTIDLDSMLSSMAEDAAEFDQDVRFLTGCGARVRVKSDALSRCLTNLIDNAVKYAGGAEIDCRKVGGEVVIEIRDHCPGMPAELIDRAFAPFVRGQGG
jgi:signal transduction histidine kinase